MSEIWNTPAELQSGFDRMYAASRADLNPSWEQRKDRLERLAKMLRENEDAIVAALMADYGQRAKADTHLAELFPSYAEISHAIKHCRKWMRPRRAHTSIWFQPAKGRVVPQPKGLVGIIAPWNYPVMLSVGPLVGAFAAGNTAMLKVSEHAPHFADWMAQTAPRYFGENELTVLRGGPELGAAFSEIPFDHIFFTGNGEIGKKVMASAAKNLTPVTLELGGKSPAIFTENVDMERAVARLMTGKMLNGGQTCVAPDYILLPRSKVGAFKTSAKAWIAKHYPNLPNSSDVTRVIDPRQFTRLIALRDDALAKGAQLTPLTEYEPDAQTRLFPPVLLEAVSADADIMSSEIFGPILPVIPFDDLSEAVAHVTKGARPLAAYYFSEDRAELDALSAQIVSGGACYNDALIHVAQTDLPFGGVGASGMGGYHGKYGFDTFSHLRATFIQSKLNGLGLFAPPFGKRFYRMLGLLKRLAMPRGVK